MNKFYNILIAFIIYISISPVIFGDILYQYNLKNTQPLDCNNLIFVEALTGGAGGVLVFKDQENKKWTLKSWKIYGHGVTENLGSILLNEMGLRTPGFIIFDELPANFAEKIPPAHKDFIKGARLFRFAEFIEGRAPTNAEMEHILDPFYAAISVISWWDGHRGNILLAHDNTLVVLDTGGSLLHRALGEQKVELSDNFWSKYQITEFKEQKLPYEHNIRQLLAILPKSPTLLSLADSFCRHLSYEKREDVLLMLASRLQHIEILVHNHYNQICSYSDPFAYCGGTHNRAGTLLWTLDAQKNPCLVLKKFQDGFGSILGAYQPDELFAQTAQRATYKETGGSVALSTQNLLMSPSHEIIRVEPNLLLNRQRIYLSYLEPTCNTNLEEQYFRLFPVSTLYASKSYLNPSLLSLLSVPQIEHWLNYLAQRVQPHVNHTRSFARKTQLQEVNPLVINPVSVYSSKIFTEALNTRDLHYRPDVLTERSQTFSGSDYMLSHLKEKKSLHENTYKELIHKLYENLSLNESQIATVLHVLQREREYSHDYSVHYHATSFAIWFSYRVLSVLDHILSNLPMQTDRIRSFDKFFERFPTAIELRDFILQGHDNYSEGYKSCGLSCNPTLFSNIDQKTSSTFDIFFNGQSRMPPKNPLSIVEVVLNDLELPPRVLAQIEKLWAEFSGVSQGALLQIFLKKGHAKNTFYAAGTMGSVWRANGEPVDSEQTIANVQQGRLSAGDDHIQTRLHANFSQLGEALVFDYFSHSPVNLGLLDQRLSGIFKPYLFEIYKNITKNNTVYNGSKSVQVKLRQELDIPKNEIGMDNFYKTYVENDIFSFFTMLENGIDILNLQITNPDSLEVIPIKDSFVQYLPKFSSDDMDELKMLASRNSLKNKDLIKLLPEIIRIPATMRVGTLRTLHEFLEQLPQLVHSAEILIQPILTSVNDNKNIHEVFDVVKYLYTNPIEHMTFMGMRPIDMTPLIEPILAFPQEEREEAAREIVAIARLMPSYKIDEHIKPITEAIAKIAPENRTAYCAIVRDLLGAGLALKLIPYLFELISKDIQVCINISTFLKGYKFFTGIISNYGYEKADEEFLNGLFSHFSTYNNPSTIPLYRDLLQHKIPPEITIDLLNDFSQRKDLLPAFLAIIDGHKIFSGELYKDKALKKGIIELLNKTPQKDLISMSNLLNIIINKIDINTSNWYDDRIVFNEILKYQQQSDENCRSLFLAMATMIPRKLTSEQMKPQEAILLMSTINKLPHEDRQQFAHAVREWSRDDLGFLSWKAHDMLSIWEQNRDVYHNLEKIMPFIKPKIWSQMIATLLHAINEIAEEDQQIVVDFVAQFDSLYMNTSNIALNDYIALFKNSVSLSSEDREALLNMWHSKLKPMKLSGNNLASLLVLLSKLSINDDDKYNNIIDLIINNLIDQKIISSAKVIALAHEKISYEAMVLIINNLKKLFDANKEVARYVIAARGGNFELMD